MSFSARETSLAAGRPIRLYEFQRGLIRWRYTNADRPVDYQSQAFEPINISDDGIRQAGDSGTDALKIVVPYNFPVARLYRSMPPASSIEVIVRDTHAGEIAADIRFMGSIQNVGHPSPERAEITCQSLQASMENPGLRVGWERGCPYSVYDHNCGVSPSVDATLSLVSALTVESGSFAASADGYFAGGYVQWSIGLGEYDRRGIERHVGQALTLLGGADGLQAGRAVTAFPGCPRTISICNSRFNNRLRYGGIPHLPGKSVFDGNPVF